MESHIGHILLFYTKILHFDFDNVLGLSERKGCPCVSFPNFIL